MLACDVEAALGGALVAVFRHEAAGVWLNLEAEFQHLRRRGHLEIKRQADFFLQPAHIVVANMPPVLAQMRGNAVGAGRGDKMRGAHRIWMRASAGVPDRRHMVDVNAEPDRRLRLDH